MVVDFMKNPLLRQSEQREDFSTALKSDVDMVFYCIPILDGQSVHQRDTQRRKKAFIHVDFAEGIGKDPVWTGIPVKQGADSV